MKTHKLLVAAISLLNCALLSQAQIMINFDNHITGVVDAPVSGPDNGSRLSGSGFTAQLFFGPAGTSTDQMQPLFPTTTFRTGAGAGYVAAVNVSAPVATGQSASLQMRVWDNQGGTITSYHAADVRGRSGIINIIGPIANLSGMQPFCLAGDSPQIIQNPQSLVISSGNNASFNGSATGAPPLSYQWRFNGSNLLGATNSVYALAPATLTNAGYYDVIVSNSSGTNLSMKASLTFLDPKMFAGLIIDGPIGAEYRVDYNTRANTNWALLTNITLTTKPQVFMDYNSGSSEMRFYRAVPQ